MFYHRFSTNKAKRLVIYYLMTGLPRYAKYNHTAIVSTKRQEYKAPRITQNVRKKTKNTQISSNIPPSTSSSPPPPTQETVQKFLCSWTFFAKTPKSGQKQQRYVRYKVSPYTILLNGVFYNRPKKTAENKGVFLVGVASKIQF